ncbi:MAG TPA: hypothetical protein V6D09_22915, partial [Leptolyngbyaceae cyanobacterium]
ASPTLQAGGCLLKFFLMSLCLGFVRSRVAIRCCAFLSDRNRYIVSIKLVNSFSAINAHSSNCVVR